MQCLWCGYAVSQEQPVFYTLLKQLCQGESLLTVGRSVQYCLNEIAWTHLTCDRQEKGHWQYQDTGLLMCLYAEDTAIYITGHVEKKKMERSVPLKNCKPNSMMIGYTAFNTSRNSSDFGFHMLTMEKTMLASDCPALHLVWIQGFLKMSLSFPAQGLLLRVCWDIFMCMNDVHILFGFQFSSHRGKPFIQPEICFLINTR